MLEKFGRTLLFVVFVLMVVWGAKMAFKVSDPYVRKVSPTVANVLAF